MSVQDARRAAARTRASYSDALVEVADALDKAVESLRNEESEVANSHYIERLTESLANALLRLRDLAIAQSFIEALMHEVERPCRDQ